MKLVFDARWTKFDRHDGISRFGTGLLEGLAKRTPVTALYYDRRQLKLLPKGPDYLQVDAPLTPAELGLPRRLNELGADVVFSPMQIMGTVGRRYKLIFMLHDTIYYQFPFPPTYINPAFRAGWWLFHQAYWPGRLVLNQADAVATVSHTSKREILDHHLTDRPVEVIYDAAPDLATLVPNAPAEPKRELVFMGTLMPYKNAETIIRALTLLPGYHLHLTGRGTPDRLAALRALARHEGVGDRITFWNGASDTEYAGVLAGATAGVSASLAEGFGLPILEAMSLGVPFLGSDLAIFHEVGGHAALYFDPRSPKSLAAQVRRLEADPKLRADLIARGQAQAAKFTWDRSARVLFKLAQGLVKEG